MWKRIFTLFMLSVGDTVSTKFINNMIFVEIKISELWWVEFVKITFATS